MIERRDSSCQPTPALAGKTLDGSSASLADLKGKFVVLNFLTSWCAPCKAATRRVRAIYDARHEKGNLAVLGVNLDHKLPPAQDYATQGNLPWPSIKLTGWGDSNPALRSYGITSPSLWLIDKDGNVVARDIAPKVIR